MDNVPPPLQDCSEFFKREKPTLKVLPKPTLTAKSDQSLLSFGLKKGFLNQEFKQPTKTNSNLVFKSVQDKFKNDLITDNFLSQIDQNPILNAAFSDPLFQQAAKDVSKDPENALKYYQKHRPDLVQALKVFAGLMGDQMIEKAVPEKLSDHEQKLVDKMLNNDKVKQALQDPSVQRVLYLAKNGKQHEMMSLISSDKALGLKVKALIDVGFLKFEN